MNKISIIIPVYNVEKYIRRCIDSILAQTNINYELILVDDGSTDSTLSICTAISDEDHRFKVYHAENQGAAEARNFGLRHAIGEYCAFIDSDDLVKYNYLEAMVNVATSSGEMIVTCCYYNEENVTLEKFYETTTSANPKYSIITMNEYRYTNRYAHTTIWAALYRTALVKEFGFSKELYVGEDTWLFAQMLSKNRSFAFVDEVYYFYRNRPGSIVQTKYNEFRKTEVIARQKILHLFNGESKEFIDECKASYAMCCMKNYKLASLAKFEDATYLKQLWREGTRCLKVVLKSKGISPYRKIQFLGFCFLPRVAVKFAKH